MRALVGKIQRKFSSDHWPVFVAGMLSSFINLFLPIVLVRILPPKEIGIYKIFFLYIHSFTFLSLAGAPLYSIFYFIGKDDAKRFIDSAWKSSILLSVLTLTLGLIFTPQIAQKINLTHNQIYLLLMTGALITPSSFYGEYLIAKGKTIVGPLFQSSFEILKGVGIVICAYITRDINTTFYFYGLSFLLKFIISLGLGAKANILTFNIDKKKLKEVLTYCAPMSSAGLLGFFLDKVDMLTLSSYLNPSDFAFYSIGCLMVPPLLILEMSVSKVLMPKLSKLWYEAKVSEMAKSLKKAQEDIAFLMIPAVFGLYLFSTPIIRILFTSKYLESVIYLKVFAFSYLAYIIPHDSVARASGETKWVLKVYLAITPISLISVAYIAKIHGALDALILSVGLKFLPKIWGLIYSAKTTKTSLVQLIPFKALGINISINILLALAVMSVKLYFANDVNWMFLTAPLYALAFFGLQFIIRKLEYTLSNPWTGP